MQPDDIKSRRTVHTTLSRALEFDRARRELLRLWAEYHEQADEVEDANLASTTNQRLVDFIPYLTEATQ